MSLVNINRGITRDPTGDGDALDLQIAVQLPTSSVTFTFSDETPPQE